MTALVTAPRPQGQGSWRTEAWVLATLAGPLVVAYVGTMLMGLVDVLMVGRLGRSALGEVALGNAYASTIVFFAIVVLGPIDAMVARARARANAEPDAGGRIGRDGVITALVLSVPVALMLAVPEPLLGMMITRRDASAAELMTGAASFSRALAPGVPFVLVFVAIRYFVEGHFRTWPGLVVVALGNVVNAAANWVLIYGHCGAPALGATGSALSTSIVRAMMCASMFAYVLVDSELRASSGLADGRRKVDRAGVLTIMRLGWPIGVRAGTSNLLIAVVIALLERFGPEYLAGNQVMLSVVLLTNSVATGFSAALGTRVGYHMAREDRSAARHAFVAAQLMSGAVALAAGVLYVAFGPALAAAFSGDPAVIASAAGFLRVSALYQIANAFAATASGGLFGLLEMKYLSGVRIATEWLIGLPLGFFLAYATSPTHVWLGLAVAILAGGVLITRRFMQRTAIAGHAGPTVREISRA